ncbi:hypothetical protein GCM10017781_24080 [Deinococcus metalli]|uniref:Uncharacterized protein n=1 Tax=Deinococcus metalli TaxID=1141878 RepID=A0ABQ3JMY1_9DEIO|nr:hypothetical protein GCM10017781_24080 [Deinococcus metalli]
MDLDLAFLEEALGGARFLAPARAEDLHLKVGHEASDGKGAQHPGHPNGREEERGWAARSGAAAGAVPGVAEWSRVHPMGEVYRPRAEEFDRKNPVTGGARGA